MLDRTEIFIDPDGPRLKKQLDGLLRSYEKVANRIQAAFDRLDMSQGVKTMVRLSGYTEKFSGQLSYLRMNLGQLKAALVDAFAPIGAVILPAINRLINRITGFAHTVAVVLSSVFDSLRGTDSAAKSAEEVAKSYQSAGKAARASLADFDQLQRLNAPTGGGAGKVSIAYDPVSTLTGDMAAMAQKLMKLLAPLRRIDLTPLRAAVQKLWEQLKPVLEQVGTLLSFLWQAVAAPFLQWCLQSLLPVLTGNLTKAIQALSNAFGPMITGVQLLYDALQPVAVFIGQVILTRLQAWGQIFGELSAMLEEKGPAICTIFDGIRQIMERLWQVAGPILQALNTQLQSTFAGVGKVAVQLIGAIIDALAGLTSFLAGIFTGNWKDAWTGVLLFFKGIVNSLIGLLNTMLTRLTGALNGVVRLVNAMKFTVPKWVPKLGGETFGFSLKTVSPPQIPYLAKGAVIPANAPFLAVLGDQRHGTNIEAPLSTIQQAMGAVMGDYSAANMAGHSATVEVLRQILEAVLGIELGDEILSGAVARQQQKLAIMRGG